MFNPSEHNLGGACIIQQQIQGMRHHIRQNRSGPSRYSANAFPTPPKVPPAPQYLTTDFRRLRPQYVLRPDLHNIETRISDEMPVSFAYSLANRRVENELKRQKMQQHKRALSARRDQRAFEAQFSSEKTAAARPQSARSARPSSSAHQQESIANRPEWNPTTQVFIGEVHGLKSLLSAEPSSSSFIAARSGTSTPVPGQINSSGRGDKKQQQQHSYYTADGIGQFVSAPELDMQGMLRGEFNRHQLQQEKAAALRQERGTLIREAARRILHRVDCMGDRVSATYRENIASSAAKLLPQSPKFLRELQQRDAELREHEEVFQIQLQHQQSVFGDNVQTMHQFDDDDDKDHHGDDTERHDRDHYQRAQTSTPDAAAMAHQQQQNATIARASTERRSPSSADTAAGRSNSVATPPPQQQHQHQQQRKESKDSVSSDSQPHSPVVTLTVESATPQGGSPVGSTNNSTFTRRDSKTNSAGGAAVALEYHNNDEDDEDEVEAPAPAPMLRRNSMVPAPPPRVAKPQPTAVVEEEP